MNLKRRARIARLVFAIHRVRSRFWWLLAHLLKIPVKVVVSLTHSTTQRTVEKLHRAAAKHQKRVDSIMPELQTINQLTEYRRHRVLATASVLLDESKHLQGLIQTFVSDGGSYSAPGASTLLTTVGYFQIKLGDISRKTTSFRGLLSRVDGDTFYWDLLLWLVVPVADAEALMGDLTEEYPLQISTLGEAGARGWYRYQVATTLRDCVWKKFERVLAIGTLIDLIDRWLRK